jgi:sporulation protein YlmC with PRC-barrel domain
MERQDRDGRDAAGIGPYAREREELVAMSTLQSWTVSAGEPDIRGWEIRTVSGRQLGTVSDLFIDQAHGEVVLLDVDLPATDRHTFVPIRVVQIDRAKRLVVMDSADLPEADLARDGATIDARDDTPGTVHYPVADREVRTAPPELADTLPPAPTHTDRIAPAERDLERDLEERPDRPVAEDPRSMERRRAERRRIDRMSTDF